MHHGAGLRKLIDDDELVAALATDHTRASLSASDRAMLDFAVKLTLRPAAVEAHDIERLREAGFDNRAVLDIVQVTAYFAFANRLADGLGIELEDYWEQEGGGSQSA